MSSKLPQYGIQGMEIGNNAERAAVEFSSMAVGGRGFTIGTSSRAVSGTNIEYYAFLPIVDTVVSAITFASHYGGDSNIVGQTIPKGLMIFGAFTVLTVSSGTVIAYYNKNASDVSY